MAFQKNKTINTINLSENRMGQEGIIALAGAIRNNNILRTIDLNNNHIGSEGAVALAGAIQNNNTMHAIDLTDNKIGPEGAVALAGAVQNNNTVHTVRLECNKIGSDGNEAIGIAWKIRKIQSLILMEHNLPPLTYWPYILAKLSVRRECSLINHFFLECQQLQSGIRDNN